jgi:hypothetical protein
MIERNKGMALRYATLAVILANVAWNYFSQAIDFGAGSMREISDRNDNLFTPAPYAFSIWGLIYLAFIVYAAVQLLPSQRNVEYYDRLNPHLIAANVLTSVWIVVFRSGYLGFSVVIIVATLLVALQLFLRAHQIVDTKPARLRLTIPFALFAGWLSVATIANVTQWIVSNEGQNFGLGAWRWAALIIAVAVLLAAVVAQRFRDVTYPAVFAWALFAIAVHDREDSLTITNFAYLAGIACAIIAIWVAYRRALLRLPLRREPKLPSNRPRARRTA